jgi:large subunit ribosomal protein L6
MILRSSIGVRTISSTTRTSQTYVSNIGKKPIAFPVSVTLTPTPTALRIEGPLGKTSIPLHPFVRLNFPEPNSLEVSVETPSVKHQRSMWGTTRTLIHNAILGMTEGYTVPLYLVGVGFRALLEEDPRGASATSSGQRLNMKVGWSHAIYVPIPPHIKAEVPTPTKIVLSCNDKQQLGLFAAKVRSHRKPEPYKGKVCCDILFEICVLSNWYTQGIFIGNEIIRIKSVKKK